MYYQESKEGMENGYVCMFTTKGRTVRQLLSVFTHQLCNSEEKLSCESCRYQTAACGGWCFRLNWLMAMWVLPRKTHTHTHIVKSVISTLFTFFCEP